MIITALNGSHRGSRGYTQILLERLGAGARQAGAEFRTVVLAEKQVRPCTGCRACQQKSRYLRCVFEDKDDAASVFEEMRSADLLVFGSPIYVFTVSSLLKTLLERIASTADSSLPAVSSAGLLFHHTDRRLCGKPFAAVLCMDNCESETWAGAARYFLAYSRFNGAPWLGALTARAGGSVGSGTGDLPARLVPVRDRILSAFERAGAELASGRRLSGRVRRQAAESVIRIPFPVGLLLKHTPLKRSETFRNIIARKAERMKGG